MQERITLQSLIELAKKARLSHSADTKYYLRLLVKRLEQYQTQELKAQELKTAISTLNQCFKVATNTLELLSDEVLKK